MPSAVQPIESSRRCGSNRKPNCISFGHRARGRFDRGQASSSERRTNLCVCVTSRRQLCTDLCVASLQKSSSPAASSLHSPASVRTISTRVTASGMRTANRVAISVFAASAASSAVGERGDGRVDLIRAKWRASCGRLATPAWPRDARSKESRIPAKDSSGVSGGSIQPRHAFASAIRCPARLPLSTVDTYRGSRGRRSRVSYQL